MTVQSMLSFWLIVLSLFVHNHVDERIDKPFYFSESQGQVEQEKKQVKEGKSTLTYTLEHPLHKIEATTKRFQCEIQRNANREITKVVFLAEVTSFDSGNSSRDSHAMEVIDAITYPEVFFESTAITTTKKGTRSFLLDITGILEFHGQTRPIRFEATRLESDEGETVEGKAIVKLSDFKVDRPKLLAIPVSDHLGIEFSLYF